MTSLWARWRLKSPALRMFTQAFDIEVAVLDTRLETVQTETPPVIHTQDTRKTPKDKILQKDGLGPNQTSRTQST